MIIFLYKKYIDHHRFLVNTGSFPLQIGGRKDKENIYPANWLKGKFVGCVRNLRVNSHVKYLQLKFQIN